MTLLDDELDEDDCDVSALLVVALFEGGVITTTCDLSGKYNGPLRPQAERQIVINNNATRMTRILPPTQPLVIFSGNMLKL